MSQFNKNTLAALNIPAALLEIATLANTAEEAITPAPGQSQPNRVRISANDRDFTITATLPYTLALVNGKSTVVPTDYLPDPAAPTPPDGSITIPTAWFQGLELNAKSIYIPKASNANWEDLLISLVGKKVFPKLGIYDFRDAAVVSTMEFETFITATFSTFGVAYPESETQYNLTDVVFYPAS